MNLTAEETGSTWLCHVSPSHFEAAPRLRQKAGPFPKRKSRLRFPSTKQVSSPRARKLAQTPCSTLFRPIHSPSRLPTGPCFCALPVAAPSPLVEERERRRQCPALRPQPAWLCQFPHGQHRELRAPRAAGEEAPAGFAGRGWRRM